MYASVCPNLSGSTGARPITTSGRPRPARPVASPRSAFQASSAHLGVDPLVQPGRYGDSAYMRLIPKHGKARTAPCLPPENPANR
jgi:hypothetical protein